MHSGAPLTGCLLWARQPQPKEVLVSRYEHVRRASGVLVDRLSGCHDAWILIRDGESPVCVECGQEA